MISSPLPKTIRSIDGLPRFDEYLINLSYHDGAIISRPGVSQILDAEGSVRGRFIFNDSLYMVSGERLIRIVEGSSGSVYVDIGLIEGSEDIEVAIGFTQAVIVVKGGKGYVFDNATPPNLTEITDPDFVPMNDVVRVNGRYVFCPYDGGPLMFSDLFDGSSIGALSFFDAEVFTDKNIGVINHRNDLYALGAESIQMFRDAGDESNPFIPIIGSTANKGYLSAKIEFGGTFCFVGKEKDQEAGIFSMGQGDANRISTSSIDRIIQSYEFDDLLKAHSQRIVWKGQDYLLFTFPGHTFCFHGGGWSYWQTVTHVEEFAPWAVRHAIFYRGKYFVGSTDSRIGVIDESNSDFGDPIRRVIKTFMRQGNDKAFKLKSLSLGVSQGQNITRGSVGLRLSDDGVLWTNRFFKELDLSGNHTFRAHWEYAGGLGYYRNGFIGVEFYTTSEVEFSVDGLTYYE